MRALRPFWRFAARDVALTALMIALWVIESQTRAEGTTTAAMIGVAAGLMTTVIAFFCHEWGHLLFALGAGGIVEPPGSLASVFLFFFDVGRSDRRAFLMMSYGGYVASVLALPVILVAVPWSALSGQVALLTASLGVIATLALEIPTTVRVARGGPLPRGKVFVEGVRG